MPKLVTTIIKWMNGHESKRVIDWEDKAQVVNFSRASSAARQKGATIITRTSTQEEISEADEHLRQELGG